MTVKLDLEAEGLINKSAQDDGAFTPSHGGSKEESAPSEVSTEEFIDYISGMLQGIQNSVANMHIGLRIMNERIALLEKYTGYLLEKDPSVGEKVRAMAAQAEAAQKQE